MHLNRDPIEWRMWGKLFLIELVCFKLHLKLCIFFKIKFSYYFKQPSRVPLFVNNLNIFLNELISIVVAHTLVSVTSETKIVVQGKEVLKHLVANKSFFNAFEISDVLEVRKSFVLVQISFVHNLKSFVLVQKSLVFEVWGNWVIDKSPEMIESLFATLNISLRFPSIWRLWIKSVEVTSSLWLHLNRPKFVKIATQNLLDREFNISHLNHIKVENITTV